MELWTEYEGRTIDNVFPLTKLLRPQGRSAFFLTSNGTGIPRVIRLIEPHFDEEEILARWRTVAALNHPHLLKLEKFGQVALDGAPLLYAVMEHVDANLADVLPDQRLNLPDARQLASSINSAIEVLHSNGFIHEHIDPANVYAVGEIVKLRSDCIRECPEGSEGAELKKRDLHDFAVLLLQSLTQQPTLEAAAGDLPLPTPFDSIVRKTMRGEWGSIQIGAALKSPSENLHASSEKPSTSYAPVSTPPERTENPVVSHVAESSRSSLNVADEEMKDHPKRGPGIKSILVIGVAIVLALWLGWHFLNDRHSNPAGKQPASGSPAEVPALQASSAPASQASVLRPKQPVDARNQWRVVAYTYNREDQARHKAEVIGQAHPDLRPEVFTPTGRAPYLVSLGGAMARDEAFALAQRARNEGLPRDTYAQNYNDRSH